MKAASAPSRTLVALLHGGYWQLYLLLLWTILFVAAAQARRAPAGLDSFGPLLALLVAPNLLAFYVFYFLIFPRFLARRRIVATVAAGALISLTAALAGALASAVFFGARQPVFTDAREFAALAASLGGLAAIHGGAALVVRGFLTWYGEIRLKEELARRTLETELALVKAQLDPHFLFNTLNNIDVLIAKDAPRASLYLNELSGLLRYAVYETKAERVALAREIEHLVKYTELQRIRTSNPDYVEFVVTGEPAGLAIAPMLFFPFVENAFKHTENGKKTHRVRIALTIEARRLVFECENTYHQSGAARAQFGGRGQELVKKRLAAAYPARHRLAIEDDGRRYKVRLTIDSTGDGVF